MEISECTAMHVVAVVATPWFAADTAAPQRQPNSHVQRLDVAHADDPGTYEQRRDIAVAKSNYADLSFLTNAVKHGRASALCAHAHHDHIGITLVQTYDRSTWRVRHLHREIVGK